MPHTGNHPGPQERLHLTGNLNRIHRSRNLALITVRQCSGRMDSTIHQCVRSGTEADFVCHYPRGSVACAFSTRQTYRVPSGSHHDGMGEQASRARVRAGKDNPASCACIHAFPVGTDNIPDCTARNSDGICSLPLP